MPVVSALCATTWRLVVRWRYGVLLLAFIVVFAQSYALAFNDWLVLEYAARVLLHRPGYPGGWSAFLHVYNDMPRLQMGPPALLAAIPTQLLNPRDGNAMAAFVMMLDGVVCVALLERVARCAGVAARRTQPAALLAGLVLLPLWYRLSITYMHIDDCMVLTLLLAAVWMMLTDKWWATALLLGTAVATKPWAIVVVPLLFALPRRQVARAGLLVFGTALAWWIPFLLAAPGTPQALNSVSVGVDPNSTFHLLGPIGYAASFECLAPGHCVPSAPGWMRPVQFVLGFALALLVVRRGRWLAAPFVGLVARVLFDAQALPYYGVGVVIAALVWDMTQGRRVPRWTLLALVGEYSYVVIDNDNAQAVIRLLMGAVVIWWFAVRGQPAQHRVARTPEEAVAAPQPATV